MTTTPLPSSCFETTTLFNNSTSSYTSCPAGFSYTFGGSTGRLYAELTCPTIPYAENFEQFRDATQIPNDSKCKCTNTMLLPSNIPMNCNCYGCPPDSQFGAGYVCSTPIFGVCTSINCNGACNGPIDFPGFEIIEDTTTIIETETEEPTSSPTLTTTQETTVEVTALTTTTTTNTTQDDSSSSSDDDVDDECEFVTELQHYVCNANTYYNLGTTFLQATLICPLEDVNELNGDLVAASHQRGLCHCETDLLRAYSRRSSFGVGSSESENEGDGDENHIEESSIKCECYICPSNSIEKYAYSCDSTIIFDESTEDCNILNCDGICNGPLDFLQEDSMITPPGSSSESSSEEQSGDPGNNVEGLQDNSSASSGTTIPIQSSKKKSIAVALAAAMSVSMIIVLP